MTMPIERSEPILAATRESFYALDRQVLGVAFEVQNEFGGYLDEEVYQTEIARRCPNAELDVSREVRIRVSHEDFFKDYDIDLLIDRCVIVEAKAVQVLSMSHKAQLLHYLFLSGTHHGSLINLRGTKVERRFVSTSLTPHERTQFKIQDLDWNPVCNEFVELKTRMQKLLEDWGADLDFRLYRDALTHCLGKKEQIRIYSQREVIGYQEVRLLNADIAFAISAIKTGRGVMHEHQQRFLKHTDLKGIAWINLNGKQIEFTTIAG